MVVVTLMDGVGVARLASKTQLTRTFLLLVLWAPMELDECEDVRLHCLKHGENGEDGY